ncbi:hypothetical protein OAP45_00075 [Candidatus Pelagibacter sp.]|nr:hypothetical protein [Candidatus Pelagibacter sp.]
MNIYIHTEISVRELDGNLLLATLAAARGHDVIISDIAGIYSGLKKKLLAPGIFHTKSLSPNSGKINRHQKLIDNNFVITSIDQEASLQDDGYEEFALTRFSDQTIKQSSAIFGWGFDDVEKLKEKYLDHASKIYMTGSPRADLWKSNFSDYWVLPAAAPKKPFLLISSNMGVCHNKFFHEQVQFKKDSGIYQRDPRRFQLDFVKKADGYRVTHAFIEAIKHLSKNNNLYDIVLRPHPTESIECWQILLGKIPNVHIIKEGPISAWINNAFAVMHNGCTTAIETVVSQKPLITYNPFDPPIAVGKLANKLGYEVKSLNKLTSTVNLIFNKNHLSDQKNIQTKSLEIISKKIYFDADELAAYKIVKIWESLAKSKSNYSRLSNWTNFKWFLLIKDLRDIFGMVLKKLFPLKFKHFREDEKFSSPFNKDNIQSRINNLQTILGINEKLECKILSKRTILIKQKAFFLKGL